MAKGSSGLFHGTGQGGKMAGKGSSATQGTNVGSGSRPTKSVYPLDTGDVPGADMPRMPKTKDPAILR